MKVLLLALFGLMSLLCQFDAMAGKMRSVKVVLEKIGIGVATGIVTNEVQAKIDESKKEPHKKIMGYEFKVNFYSSGKYSGVISMKGRNGIFLVTDPNGREITQDMTAIPHSDDVVILQGSNPREQGRKGAMRAPNYSEDSFRLTKVQGSGWTIGAACNNTGRCTAVEVLDAKTFYFQP